MSAPSPLAYRLGAEPTQRLAIFHARGFGVTHAANTSIRDALDQGAVTTASLMLPCPWARESAALYRGDDVGLMLTMNSELPLYRWGPVTHAPSLVDGNSSFPRSAPEFWDHADLDEVRREARAQLERAVVWGFDITFLDSHLGALLYRPEFFDVVLDLAIEYSLPISLPGTDHESDAGFPFRSLATEEGVLFPDHRLELSASADDDWVARLLDSLLPGVTEIVLSPARESDELSASDPARATARALDDRRCRQAGVRETLEHADVQLTSYRALRSVQRLAANS